MIDLDLALRLWPFDPNDCKLDKSNNSNASALSHS